jgi:hypothetical protein
LLGDLQIVNRDEDVKDCRIINNTIDRQLLRQGDEKVSQGKIGEAKLLYRKCFDYIEWMPEPKLRLAIAALHQGETDEALKWISNLLDSTIGKYEAQTPDPVEWSWFLLCLLCCGKIADASKFSDYFPALTHKELQRARWTVYAASGRVKDATAMRSRLSAPESAQHSRKSIHQLSPLTFDEYLQDISRVLRACGQGRLARKLAGVAQITATNGDLPQPDTGDRHVTSSDQDVSELLRYLQDIRSADSSTVKTKLKARAPQIASAINSVLSRQPALKAKMRTFALNYLKIQDW